MAGTQHNPHTLPMQEGVLVVWEGKTFEAVKQETLGWTWMQLDGPPWPYRWSEYGFPRRFDWDHPIYDLPRRLSRGR